ncbi:hypothetical protein XV92_17645 [Vibrio metoecus]|uniref:Uncharacterized protein n=1 Tax=Vibrio metoecus TaxID=1481663 RepID=A0A0N8V9D1_VIBMT|nr:hypothetical protein [Vibrio metoecus]KQA98058.1 hypothetical protein XV92_17645 [Vibrio metoecus]
MIEMVIALCSMVVAIVSVVFKFNSKKNLDETQRIVEKTIEEITRINRVHERSFDEISSLLKDIEALKQRDIDDNKFERIDVTYSKYLRTTKMLQSIGRASRLKEKQPAYQKLWMFLNSGLVNSTLKNVMYNDESSEIDKNSIVGMLVGEKIKKDTKSYIFIMISTIISIVLPLLTNSDVNFWLISFLLSLFSLLVLNQKLLEYRITNGFYGSNQYEAREIIGYIEQHSSDDDFTGFNDKKTFPKTQSKRQECSGLLGGLIL